MAPFLTDVCHFPMQLLYQKTSFFLVKMKQTIPHTPCCYGIYGIWNGSSVDNDCWQCNVNNAAVQFIKSLSFEPGYIRKNDVFLK